MTLRGMDVSNWQGDIAIGSMDVDFVVVKATEDTDYVDPYCDRNVSKCKASGKLFGFYHYGGSGDPVKEADFFVDNCLGYFRSGIPVLDWEEGQSVSWVNRFVRRVHERTGIWPWIYANPWRFNQGGVEPNCMRWVASYPAVVSPTHKQAEGWDCPEADGFVGCWQFCSDGRLPGYDGSLDLDLFYGTKEAWLKYAGYEEDSAAHKEPDGNEGKSFTVENSEYKVTVVKK